MTPSVVGSSNILSLPQPVLNFFQLGSFLNQSLMQIHLTGTA